MKISEIIADKYKLRIPPTVYYELLADVQDAEEEQEPKYCDRSICIKNEYNGIGCNDCEVTKSQKQSGDLISRDAVIEQTYLWSKDEFLRITNPFDYLRKRIMNLPSVNPQEPKTDSWSIKDVADTFKKHGLIREQEPCDDAISRQAVLEIQAKYAEHIGATKFWQMRDDIEALPSVNPQEPKTGHWINQDEGAFYPIDSNRKYCANCGVKMQESEEISDTNLKMWQEIFKAKRSDKE